MKKLSTIYNIVTYSYLVLVVLSMVLLFTNLTYITSVSYWLLGVVIFMPLIVSIVIFLGGFSYHFSIDIYKRYQTFRAIKLGKQAEQEQRDIQDMLDKLKQ